MSLPLPRFEHLEQTGQIEPQDRELLLQMPLPGRQIRSPLLAGNFDSQRLAGELNAELAGMPGVSARPEGQGTVLEFTTVMWVPNLETQPKPNALFPPLSVRKGLVKVYMDESGIQRIEQTDDNQTGDSSIPIPANTIQFTTIPDTSPGAGNALLLSSITQTAEIVPGKGQEPTVSRTFAYTPNDQGQLVANVAKGAATNKTEQSTQDLNDTLNKFGAYNATDKIAALAEARALQASGRSDIMVGTADAAGNVAVVGVVMLDGAMYFRKYIVNEITGQTTYFFVGGATHAADPRERDYESVNAPGNHAIYDYDSLGRLSRVLSRGTEGSINGVLPYTDWLNFTYDDVQLVDGTTALVRDTHRELLLGSNRFSWDFNFTRNVVEAPELDATLATNATIGRQRAAEVSRMIIGKDSATGEDVLLVQRQYETAQATLHVRTTFLVAADGSLSLAPGRPPQITRK